jgi:hypothetical protein
MKALIETFLKNRVEAVFEQGLRVASSLCDDIRWRHSIVTHEKYYETKNTRKM